MKMVSFIVGGFGVVVLAAVLRAWVLTVLWEWFLVPLGLPALAITTALGISLLVGMFTEHLNKETTDSNKDTARVIGTIVGKAFITPLVYLLGGWIITLFM